jgi:Ca-activated chloride channel family protein
MELKLNPGPSDPVRPIEEDIRNLKIEVPETEGAVKGGVLGGVVGGVRSDVRRAVYRHRPGEPSFPHGHRGHPNTEEYSRIYENVFLPALTNPLSTFSIDVDTASYANIRRFINDGRFPYQDAVRIEEMINYFSYPYPAPKQDLPFAVYTEISTCPWNPKHRLIHLGLQGKKMKFAELPASNLVFLLDVSGSMRPANKLPLLQQAFKLLVKELSPRDRVAVVVYAGAAGVVLPSTSAGQKATISAAIERLQAGGSTAGGAGIRLAYKIAEENFMPDGNNRVILATDGDFNVGVSSTSELVRMIEAKRKKGVFLTVLGLGMGNYKDGRMEQLADKGNGNYHYIDNLMEAKKVFIDDMRGTLFTIAKDVKLQLEFNPAKVKAYRLIGYENRMLKKEDFADDTKDAGELGAGHTVTALYEIIPYGSDEAIPGGDELKYQQTRIDPAAFKSRELLTAKLRYKDPNGEHSKLIQQSLNDQAVDLAEASRSFKFSAAVAAFGMLLRDSEFKGNATYTSILQLARAGKGDDFHGYRAEFIQLVEKARLLHSLASKTD